MTMEDKQMICDRLLMALRATREHSDLIGLDYETDEKHQMQFVTAEWLNGNSKKINVTLDSGVAMIRDIMEALS